MDGNSHGWHVWVRAAALLWAMAIAPAALAQADAPVDGDEANTRLADIARSAELVKQAELVIDRADNLQSWLWAAQFDKARDLLNEALELDPDNKQAAAELETLDERKAARVAEHEKLVDANPWPGHDSHFKGSGSPRRLAAEVLAWLQADAGWKRDNPIAVAVRGDWKSIDELPGIHMEWALPVWVAVYPDPSSDVVWVYPATLHTARKRNVAQAPPFVRAVKHAAGAFQMRRQNVPAMETDDGGGGVLWLMLVLANATAGTMLIKPWVTTKTDKLEGLYRLLERKRSVVGVCILATGALCLLIRLLSFSPAAAVDNLLPQLSAIVAGAYIGRRLLLRKPAATPANVDGLGASEFTIKTKAQKTTVDMDKEIVGRPIEVTEDEIADAAADTPAEPANDPLTAAAHGAKAAAGAAQDLLIEHKGVFDRLKPHEMPMGVTCLALAVLHLLVGGALPLV